VDRQLKSTLIVIGVIALLGMGAAADQIRERMLTDRPLAVTPSTLHSIVVRSQGLPERRFEHRLGHWRMTAPYDAAVADATVQSLIGVLRAPSHQRYPEKEFDPGAIGLANPVASIEFDGVVYPFGAQSALHQERYVRSGHEIVLVPDRYLVLLTQPAEQLVDPRPFADFAEIADIRAGGSSLPASAVVTLPGLSARRVVARSGDPPGLRIELTNGSGHRRVFALQTVGDGLSVAPLDVALTYQIDSVPPALRQALAGRDTASARDAH
jgi:hypothetical protein